MQRALPPSRAPRVHQALLALGLGLLVVPLLAACGAGSDASAGSAAAPATFLPTSAMPSDEAAVFLIRGAFARRSGPAVVRFRAEEGTPFFEGRTATLESTAHFELPGQLRGTLPAPRIPHTAPAVVRARVTIHYADGASEGELGLQAHFAPLPPPPPPTIAALSPSLLLSGAPTCFTLHGTRFFAASGDATLELRAASGTPFHGGTRATLSVPVVIESPELARGRLPGGLIDTELRASLTLHMDGGLRADSRGAILTLAPERKIVADGGAAFDHLGTAVALSGDTAVVGARLADTPASRAGAAYVFTRQGAAWVEQQMLVAPDGGLGDEFGTSVAIDGDTLVVGAPFDDDAASNAGCVHVFVRREGLWSFEAKLTAADAAPGDHLGRAVAIDGGQVVAGAPDENNSSGANAGAVYVFARSGNAWSERAKLTTTAVAAGEQLGHAVALSGASLLVGAPGADAAFAYEFDGLAWGREQMLRAPDTLPGDDFGRSVAVAGDRLVVGAPTGDGAATASGVAHVFVRGASGWLHERALSGVGGQSGDAFGCSVAIDGDLALVGALNASVLAPRAGAAYPFTRAGPGDWLPDPILTASDGAASDRFGQAVALSACAVLIGAPLENNAGGTDAGAAYFK